MKFRNSLLIIDSHFSNHQETHSSSKLTCDLDCCLSKNKMDEVFFFE